MLFDSKLNWAPHLKIVKARATRNLNLIKILPNSKFGSDRKLLLRIHKMTILPSTEYGSFLFTSAPKSTQKILDPVHHFAIRLAIGAFRTSPTKTLLIDSGNLPLNLRREKYSLSFTARILAFKNHPLYEEFKSERKFEKFEYRKSNRQPFYVRARILYEKYDMEVPIFDYQTFSKVPPWLKNLQIDTSLTFYKKSETSEIVFRKVLQDKLQKMTNFRQIYTDGSFKGSQSGCAFVANELVRKIHLPDHTSIFTAELYAIQA